LVKINKNIQKNAKFVLTESVTNSTLQRLLNTSYMKSIIASTLLVVAVQANAFTLDFVAYNGATIPPSPLVINVFGYGNVSFAPGFASALEVGNRYENDGGTVRTSLQMDPNESIVVTFLGAEPTNVDFDIIGLGAGESVGLAQLSTTSFLVSTQGGDGSGLQAVSWGAVPEPSATLLGAFGVLALAARRRRN